MSSHSRRLLRIWLYSDWGGDKLLFAWNVILTEFALRYCCARKPARWNAHPLTKTQDLLRLISGAKHPERISLSGVLVFTLAVSLRKARSHYSEHKANQWVPALLIRGPAISVWVVVLWCKDSKMSGSLVDQVNHALSLKQRSSAVLRPADWLADCLLHSQHTKLWEAP